MADSTQRWAPFAAGRGLNPSGEKVQRCVRSEYLAQGLSQDSVRNLRCVRNMHMTGRAANCALCAQMCGMRAHTIRANMAVQCSVRIKVCSVLHTQTHMLVPGRAARSSTRKVCVSIHTQPFLFAPPAQNQAFRPAAVAQLLASIASRFQRSLHCQCIAF